MVEAYSDETKILRRLREGDAHAFEMLFNLYWKSLYQSAYRRLHSREEAEDIVQELLASVWRRRTEIVLNDDNSMSAYLFTALRYRIISFYAGVKTERFYGEVLEKLLEIKDDDQFAHLVTRELHDLIQLEINSMPDNMKQVYKLTREHDYSIKEAAAQAGLSEQTVKNLITYATKRLRAKVEEYYNDQSPQAVTILVLSIIHKMVN